MSDNSIKSLSLTASFLLAVLPATLGCQGETPSNDEGSTAVAPTGTQRPISAYRYPSYVTRFDISTHDALKYAHLLRPFTTGDLTDWKLLNDAAKELSGYIGNLLDAEAITDLISTSMPVRGHAPLKPIDELVKDCAKILGVSKPEVFIRNDPVPQIYVAVASKPQALVITSGLLDLYDGSADELRFMIGRELGHIKCQHVELRLVSRAIIKLLQLIDNRVLKGKGILPTLALGRFLSWSREAEVSADRAGLLCCQDVQVAYNAMARMLHGLSPNSSWPDPNHPDFDPNTIVGNVLDWESRPFVEFVVAIKRQSAEHPFVFERIAALKLWHDSGIPSAITARTKPPGGAQFVQLDLVLVKGLADGDATVDPYLRVIGNDGATTFKSVVQDSVQVAAWKDLDRSIRCQDGQPVFVEIWDHNDVFKDELLGMFTLNPERGIEKYETAIIWDVYERQAVSRRGIVKAMIKFHEERS